MARVALTGALRAAGAAHGLDLSRAAVPVLARAGTTFHSRSAPVPPLGRFGAVGARLMSSGGVEERFKVAVVLSKGLSANKADDLLKLYALYKQAEHGKCDDPEPGIFELRAKAKWNAWRKLGSMSREDAMAAYIQLVEDLSGSPPPSPPPGGGTPAAPVRSALVSHSVDEKGVATVVLDSVTMPPQLFLDVGKVVRALSEDDSVRVIVVRGGKTKPHFSYGLDLKSAGGSLMNVRMDGPRHQLHKLIKDWQGGFDAIAESPKPVIAAIEGWCIGAGLDLISACDVRLASADAKISLREAALGIVADLGSLNRLPPIIGDSNTRMMALTACDVKADRALAMGLVSEVYPTGDELYAAAQAMAEEMASRDPNCLMGIKNVMNNSRDKAVREGLDYVAAWNSAFLPMQDLAAKVLGGK